MRFWSTYVLKWELSREREIDLKSSTEKKNPNVIDQIYIPGYI